MSLRPHHIRRFQEIDRSVISPRHRENNIATRPDCSKPLIWRRNRARGRKPSGVSLGPAGCDAAPPRWTKKNDESFYGYKNHLGVDKAHKLIRKWDATVAAAWQSGHRFSNGFTSRW